MARVVRLSYSSVETPGPYTVFPLIHALNGTKGCKFCAVHELGPLSFWELFAVTVGASAIFGWVSVWFTHRRLKGHVRDGHYDVVIPIYATAGVIYAVLLAFIVIAVWEQFTSARDNVANEASSLTTMYRETEAMPRPEQQALRALLRTYTRAVAEEEWKVQSAGGASPVARAALIEMYGTIDKYPPTVATTAINQAFVAQLSEMAVDRTKRTLASQDRLPWILWVALIVGGLVVVGMSAALYMENVQLHAALSASVAALIGMLLFATLVLDRPFAGRLGIKPEAYEHALSVFDSVDRAP